MNSTERPDCTSLCPMAHIACVLPVPGMPNASTLTPLSTKSPSASLTSCCLSLTGARSCSKVSHVLPAGSLDALLSLSTLLYPPVLGLLLQNLHQCRQSVSVSRVAEAVHGFSRKRRQPELPAQSLMRSSTALSTIPDAIFHSARRISIGRHRAPPASSLSYTPRSTSPGSSSAGISGDAGAASCFTTA